jgi:hypothetical protein
MTLVRKHKRLLVILFIAIFAMSIRQSGQVVPSNLQEVSCDLVVKMSPYVAGFSTYSNLEKSHQSISFFPVKLLFQVPNFTLISQYNSGLPIILSQKAQFSSAPSLLGFICKLQI